MILLMPKQLLIVTLICLAFIACKPLHAREHTSRYSQSSSSTISPSDNQVTIRESGDYRYITSNGLPDHVTGTFPNRQNPNSISAQDHNYRVTINPKLAGKTTDAHLFGIALNGILFEPGTAECWGQTRGGSRGATRGRRPSSTNSSGPGTSPGGCQWREEALVGGRAKLGLDANNAHVQPTGNYHYHAIPHGLVETQGDYRMDDDDFLLVGYAADGFEMYISQSNQYRSSYRLKSGSRPSDNAPGGRYDGSYTADFEYDRDHGQLDQCNGAIIDGEYRYILTETFPYIPRCWKGTPDSSFIRRHQRGGTRSR